MSVFAHRQLPLSAQDAALARSSAHQIARLLRHKSPLTLAVRDADPAQFIELPSGAVLLLMDILETMGAGRGVTVIPENAELTTARAAEMLNVSRPFLIQLLDKKALPSRKVGTHRRVRVEDVMAYKARIDADREAILDRLVAEAQESDMGYGSP